MLIYTEGCQEQKVKGYHNRHLYSNVSIFGVTGLHNCKVVT